MTVEPATASPATIPPTRLTRGQDFVAVLQQGQRVRHPLFGLGFRPNGLEHSRVGFAVGKRVGNAVIRNLVRRRLRAITRLTPLRPGFDIVVTARAEAATASYNELDQGFRQCARRGRLLIVEGAG